MQKLESEETQKRKRSWAAIVGVIAFLLLLLGGSFWPVVAGLVLDLRDGASPARAPVVAAPAPVHPVNAVQPVVVQPVAVLPSGPPTLAEDLFPLAVGYRWTFVSRGFRSEVVVTGKERAVIDGSNVEVFRLASPPPPPPPPKGDVLTVSTAASVRRPPGRSRSPRSAATPEPATPSSSSSCRESGSSPSRNRARESHRRVR